MSYKQPFILSLYCLACFLFASCERTTPVEMLFGKWKVDSIVENGHRVTDQYVSSTSRYLVLHENGSYQLGLIDTTTDKSWIVYSDDNQLVLLNDALIDDVKKWEVYASDNQLQLKYKERALSIVLKRIEKLPEPNYKEAEDLIGKWIVEKVTINGTNSTSNYAYPDRWIILAKNGRFYNGESVGNQNAGFWKANDELTRLEFRLDQNSESPALQFTIAQNSIWYEKEKEEGKKHTIRIYFKKEES